MVNKTKIDRFEISDQEKTRISYMIHTYRPDVLGKKFREPLAFNELPASEKYQIAEAKTRSRI
jgi:hypothetical protein